MCMMTRVTGVATRRKCVGYAIAGLEERRVRAWDEGAGGVKKKRREMGGDEAGEEMK